MGVFWGKRANRRRRTDWRIVDDLGLTTGFRRGVAYMFASGAFMLAFCLAVVAAGEKSWFSASALGVVAVIAGWAVIELGTSVGLGPKDDTPAPARKWERVGRS